VCEGECAGTGHVEVEKARPGWLPSRRRGGEAECAGAGQVEVQMERPGCRPGGAVARWSAPAWGRSG
jgi:hypothetical protein